MSKATQNKIRRLVRKSPFFHRIARYIYGVSKSGIGLIDQNYETLSWSFAHETLWRFGGERMRDRLSRSVIASQWHHVGNLESKNSSNAKELDDALLRYEKGVENDLGLYFLSEVEKSSDILELGSGIGAGGKALASSCRSYIGIDVSKPSVRVSEHRCRDLPNVRFQWNNGYDLHMIGNDSIDLIHCGGTFMHMELIHMFGYLKEFHRVLRPGGRICISYSNLEVDRWFNSFIEASHRQLYLPYSALSSYRVRYFSTTSVRRMLESIGFYDLKFFNKQQTTETSQADHCWATK